MDIDNLTLGQRIKDIRLQCGDTQEEFAKRIGNGKGSKATINNYEKGRNKPSASRLKKIADLGDTTVNELLHGRDDLTTNNNSFGEKRVGRIDSFRDLIYMVKESREMTDVLLSNLLDIEKNGMDDYDYRETQTFFSLSIGDLTDARTAFDYYDAHRDRIRKRK
ncbi:helix-turn-helix domain-containing protein [Ligilactobacillus acidipiscis]|uniref:helix-turn-helix domain-containing protein n=1 Tax=Ligilactobacillus acidipiscis TaxID=89059 RepID=UPI0023FA245F|nr:helix-turn-helix transcriptional regulator [Ligilactobacillus acidipiscis]WEV57833.1 helix-turn-helix transcriptional regulator [Ligilactobacillus acidipiscis]